MLASHLVCFQSKAGVENLRTGGSLKVYVMGGQKFLNWGGYLFF